MSKIDFIGFKPPIASMPPVQDRKRVPLESVEPAAPVDMLKHLIERFPGHMTFSLQEVADMLGVDYETVRCRTAAGDIASIQFGTRRLIPIHELARILTSGVT